MGIFDFLKPKRDKLTDYSLSFLKMVFPNGEIDYEVGTNEILNILNNSVSKDIARNIFIKSTVLCRVVAMKKDGENKFDLARLKLHLSGYCIQYFTDDQIERLYDYQISLLTASLLGKSPKDVKRSGSGYYA